MSCDEFRSAFLAGEVGTDHGHLNGCPACRSRLSELQAWRASISNPAVWEEPPDSLAAQVSALISGGMEPAARRPGRRWLIPVMAGAIGLLTMAVVVLTREPPPDWSVTAAGTTLEPSASAEISGWSDDVGTRMVLDVTGLRTAPQGSHYELWLSGNGIYVSAGTFSGAGRIETWAGVQRADFPRLWVTLEPTDGDPYPSQQTVLDTG